MTGNQRYELVSHDGQEGIRCLRCRQISFSKHDVENRYCARCHAFLDDEEQKSSRETMSIAPEDVGSMSSVLGDLLGDAPEPAPDPSPAIDTPAPDPGDISGGGGDFGGGGASSDF